MNASFVDRNGLWGPEQYAAAERIQRTIDELGIDRIRVSFADQHGIPHGKTLTVPSFRDALADGHGVPSTLVLKDTSGRNVYPVFTKDAGLGMPELAGVGDMVLVPDPTTFRVLPWADRTAWVLCDGYFRDGRPVPFATRHICRRLLDELAGRGYEYVVGLEVEFHVFRLDHAPSDPADTGWPGEPPRVSMLGPGYQLLADQRIDQLDDVVALIHATADELTLDIRSIEVELGPSQLEVTFGPQPGLRAADDMVLFRSAMKQACRRRGYHASFMCRPHLPNIMSSGWHLHQSLRELATGENAFATSEDALLSPLGRHFLGGILEHARSASVFTTPTINGYKRYRPYSLAPDHVVWGVDNKGAMVRLVGGGADPVTHLENRCGEPAANPYLYIAAQLVSGLDGVDRGLSPGEPTETPYEGGGRTLPVSLIEAVDELRQDPTFAKALGSDVVDYLIAIKQAEINRFLTTVTDWEQREYFEML